ncbi:hypothetical protein J3359_06290 [Polaribacter cellanae]|uniref:Uncharacterized protein n=1 Tax=Polaribacter cellanae TaxID=2818493 RepID=A0A975CR80_9FLAO|nr:hypothetical protein [Polaribacter cellanae]QTE23875.1 hypothetical protein J3359_06290 [Polaribacter cellanae]
MKSIHNYDRIINFKGQLVNSHVKIQFEINSQQVMAFDVKHDACEFSRKNTI